LLGKISNISFLGNWDFSRSFAYARRGEARRDTIAALEKDFEFAPKKAEGIANVTAMAGQGSVNPEFFSERFSFSSEPKPGKKNGRLISFDNGVVYDQVSSDVLFYNASEQKYFTPSKVIFYESGIPREIINDKGDFQKTVVLVKTPEKEQAFIAEDALATSLLVKLYFLNGAGLQNFKLFYADDEKGIFIYEIVWGEP